MPATAASARVARNDAAEPFGIAIQGSHFVFTGAGEAPTTDVAVLPRSPMALSAGALEILAALAGPSLARRQT